MPTQRTVGMILVVVGVGLCAALGSRPIDAMQPVLVTHGRAAMRQAVADEAHAAYCDARVAAALPDADGCGDAALPEPPPPDADQPAAERLAALRAHVDRIAAAVPAELPDAVGTARSRWIAAWKAALPAIVEAEKVRPPAPAKRVGAWARQAGPGFAAGLLLLVVGAVLTRRATRADAMAAGPEGRPGAVDLGQMLLAIRDTTAELATACADPDALDAEQARALRARIDALCLDRIEPVVEARHQVEARHGLAAHAALYGPLATGERWLHRAWSAFVDGHLHEGCASVQTAARAFEQVVAEARALGLIAG